MSHSSISRRRFLAGTVASCVPLLGARSASSYAANERLGIALVGIGGRGSWFVGSIPRSGERVVALCDVNEKRAAESFAALPDVPRYRDFRKMLDDRDREIDAVIVATPDNTHAVITMAALRAGKHAYCEKPLTHDVLESRELAREAARSGLATQMGNQGTASEGFRRALEIIRSGLLGEIREVHAWKDDGGQGDRPTPQGSEPVPDHLDWDLWLGPAAERPYHPQWMRWDEWRDFGTGRLGNWGCHVLNLPFHALALAELWRGKDGIDRKSSGDGAAPSSPGERRVRIEARCLEYPSASFPRWAIIRWTFPGHGERPPVPVTWYSGLAQRKEERERIHELMGRPLDFGDHGRREWDDHAGCLLVGTKGKMHLNAHNTTFTLLPEEELADVEEPERFVLRSPGHEAEWIRACKGGRAGMSRFENAGPLTEIVLLGHVATRFDRPLEFDPVAMEIVSDAEADAALRRAYRKGWELRS